jgi:hypothetical protein
MGLYAGLCNWLVMIKYWIRSRVLCNIPWGSGNRMASTSLSECSKGNQRNSSMQNNTCHCTRKLCGCCCLCVIDVSSHLLLCPCRTIYNMCTQKPPHDYSEQLYDRYRSSFEIYIKEKVHILSIWVRVVCYLNILTPWFYCSWCEGHNISAGAQWRSPAKRAVCQMAKP